MNTQAPRMRLTQLATALALTLSGTMSAFAFDLAQTPLFIPTPLDPNLIVTLDDSGSMTSAYAPDGISGDSATRRFKSSAYNPIYYNPDVTYLPAIGAAGEALPSCSNASTAAACMESTYVNGFNPALKSHNLRESYRPSLSYNPTNTTPTYANHPTADFAGSEFSGVPAYYYVYTGSNCLTDDNCYTKVDVGEAEYFNFSNWYAFYRTRNLMTMTGASRAFAGLAGNIRIAWQGLNTCASLGTTCTTATGSANNEIRKFANDHRSNFFNWLARLPASGTTPLQAAFNRAGTYYTTTGVNSPYAEDPQVTAGTEYSCRPNFHIAMTDGIWNGEFSATLDGDEDNVTLPEDGRTYSPTAELSRIYTSSDTNNIADIAFHFWVNDLRTDLDNDLPPFFPDRGDDTKDEQFWNPRNDPATWQHMVNFTVGLGLTRSLTEGTGNDWTGDTFSGSLIDGLRAGTRTWPPTGNGASPGNVYDLWHAAINSRGQFFSADDPKGLTDAFESALGRVIAKSGSAAALATNSTRLGTGTAVFQARFDSSTWSGDLYAIPLNPDGSTSTAAWNAAAHIPAHGIRKIFTWDNASTSGTTFTLTGLSNAQETGLLGTGLPADQLDELVDYLRGDNSNEQPNGLGYRKRTRAKSITNDSVVAQSPLGDIINSDPAFVSSENFGYNTLLGAEWSDPTVTLTSPYDTFRAEKAERPRVVYVAANDGMLHAFDAGVSSTTASELIGTGEELFAYIPNAAIPNQAALADPSYAHRYLVDGAPSAGDAYVGGGWKTMLVGSLGAGGKAVYALDVTDPLAFDATKVHWEFTHSELGNSMGKPTIARLANGKWVAVFGNGPNSTSGTAKLFMVELSKKIDGTWTEGNHYWVVNTDTTLQNGLSEPTLYDENGDRIIDYIYAGDLLGRVWKFDVRSTSGSYAAGTLIFTANTNQPITSPIEIGRAPTGLGGVMLYFGTGRFFAKGDNLNTDLQSFYGVHDDFSVTGLLQVNLVKQTILYEGADTSSGHDANQIRLVSENTVDYFNKKSPKKGWYLDLAYNEIQTGERVVSAPLLRFDRVIFTTLIPSTDPCDFGGESWLMELDAINGARLSYSVFDLDANKLFNEGDMVSYADEPAPVSGLKSKVGITKTPAVISAGEIEYKVMSGTTGEIQVVSEKGGKKTGRTSWREIFNK